MAKTETPSSGHGNQTLRTKIAASRPSVRFHEAATQHSNFQEQSGGQSLALTPGLDNCQDGDYSYDEEYDNSYAGPLPCVLLQLLRLLEGYVPTLNMVHCTRDLRTGRESTNSKNLMLWWECQLEPTVSCTGLPVVQNVIMGRYSFTCKEELLYRNSIPKHFHSCATNAA